MWRGILAILWCPNPENHLVKFSLQARVPCCNITVSNRIQSEEPRKEPRALTMGKEKVKTNSRSYHGVLTLKTPSYNGSQEPLVPWTGNTAWSTREAPPMSKSNRKRLRSTRVETSPALSAQRQDLPELRCPVRIYYSGSHASFTLNNERYKTLHTRIAKALRTRMLTRHSRPCPSVTSKVYVILLLSCFFFILKLCFYFFKQYLFISKIIFNF